MPSMNCAVLASMAAALARGYHVSSEVSSNMSTGGLPAGEVGLFDIDAAGQVLPGDFHRTAEDFEGGFEEGFEEGFDEDSEEGADVWEDAEEGESEGVGVNGTFEKSRVLLVDMRGPTGTTGDGVRTMGLLMDLKSKQCRHQVEVLSDTAPKELKASWIRKVAHEKFSGVHLWTNEDHKRHAFDVGHFHRIIIGAKLELLYEDKRAGKAVPAMINQLKQRHDIPRKSVSVFWDDVPFDRCQFKPGAAQICPRVNKHVLQMCSIAHTFHVLSVDDKARMTRHMKHRGLWDRCNIVVNVWPMRIRNMWAVLPWERFTYNNYHEKNLVTMMGNKHAVNKRMVNFMFEQGIVGKLCRHIKEYKSKIELYFMGGLAAYALTAKHQQLGKTDMSCVVIRNEYVAESELRDKIIPKTRAVMNPFFFNINSGISVKNFESVMMGVPFVTSRHGMHGLSDEFKPCTWYPMPKKPESAEEFVAFFKRNVISPKGYVTFAEKFHKISPRCARAQHVRYPTKHQCW